MKRGSIAYIIAFLITTGILAIGLFCPVIWHGEIVLSALRLAAALIPAAAGISILLACLRCLPSLWKKN